MAWATRVVAAGALAGIVTALFGSMLGQARTYVTMGRQHMLPAWLVSGCDTAY
jgi:APA family basic amino acid/polyamine antiporter